MSNTPRTDAIVGNANIPGNAAGMVQLAAIYSALLSHARHLERELSEALACREHWKREAELSHEASSYAERKP